MITADDVYALFRPSSCRRRVYLLCNRPELAAPPSEYARLIMTLGQEHEKAHLATLPAAVKPEYSPGDIVAGAQATRILIERGAPVIYQGVLLSESSGLSGIPDFLVRKANSYILRDAKLAINLEKHFEIPAQLSLYARAFQDSVGRAPAGTEVFLGDRSIVKVSFTRVEEVAREIADLKQGKEEPDEAVGWSKCSECAFVEHCWSQAEKRFDPGIVYGVDQGLRNALIDVGVDTYHKLVKMPAELLAELERPWGKGRRRVGHTSAEKIRRQAETLISGIHQVFGVPELPRNGSCVYFDIEADPHDEGLENKVYLWGVLTDRGNGSRPEYWGMLAREGEEGDTQGWLSFLRHVAGLLEEMSDIPFVHYSHYEKTWLKKYIERWGDVNGTGTRVLDLLWDMQRKAIQRALCLPLPSYGLKVVEQYAGFERSQKEYGGLWSVVRYHEWLKARSGEERRRLGEEILRYNREDCEAMMHVLDWVREIAQEREPK